MLALPLLTLAALAFARALSLSSRPDTESSLADRVGLVKAPSSWS